MAWYQAGTLGYGPTATRESFVPNIVHGTPPFRERHPMELPVAFCVGRRPTAPG